MLSYLVGLWMAAAVGQAPAEASWLESVPADIPVVARVRAPEDVAGDLMAMLGAMSPNAAEAARGVIEPAFEQFEESYSKAAVKNPFFVLFRLPDPAQPDLSGWGVIAKTGDAAAMIKGLGQDGEKPKSLDGYESFAARDGQTWYAARGAGWVAFGPDEAMIKAIHKPRSSLAQASRPRSGRSSWPATRACTSTSPRCRSGMATSSSRPGRRSWPSSSRPPMRGPRGVESTKQVVDALLEALKAGESLALSLDFDAAGLTLSGLATVKADTPAAKGLAQTKTGTGRLLEKLPSDKMAYVYTADFSGYRAGQPGPGAAAKASPAKEQATAARTRALEGRLVFGITLMPMQFTSLADPSDPRAAVKAALELDKVSQAEQKEKMTIEPDALTYRGFRLSRARAELDPQQIAKAAGNQVPNAEQVIGKMLAGNALTSYRGTDGKLFLEAAGPSEEQLKAQIDAIQDGSHSLGASPSWKALRGKFPEQVTVLVLLNAQETVKMILTSVGAMQNNDAIKPPADLPRAPALMGFALIASPQGYDFRLIVPSDVGPVFEKGLAPLTAGQ